MFIQDIFIAGKITVYNSLLLTDLKNVWKKVFKNYIFVDKIYIEILKFGDFNFSDSLKNRKSRPKNTSGEFEMYIQDSIWLLPIRFSSDITQVN